MRFACFGDVHNSLENLEKLYDMLAAESIDAVFSLGDLIDRGPDPRGVIKFCMQNGIEGVAGNHDEALLRKHILTNSPPKNPDKLKSYEAVLSLDGAVEWLAAQPKIRVIGRSVLVHAGVDPFKSIEQQNSMCCYVAMVNPKELGQSRWWGQDRKGRTEEQNRQDGWVRWYEAYAFPYDVYHGHSVHRDPLRVEFANSAGYYRHALDTGAYFTGMLSAAIVDSEKGFEKFVSTPKIHEGKYFESGC